MNVLSVAQTRPLILNVNTDAVTRAVVTRSLRRVEMDVIEAKDGDDAVAVIGKTPPSLVLLELDEPHAKGLKVCQRLKAACPDTFVVHVSAIAKTALTRIKGFKSDADCTLMTPVEPLERIAVIRAMLRLRGAEIKALEESERYRVVFDNAIDCAIFTCGLDGRIMTWNAGAQAILGYSAEDVIGEPHACIFMADDVAAEIPDSQMRSAYDGVSVRAERWHLRRDGTRFWSHGRMLALRNRSGEVSGYLTTLHDRSIEKEARDALDALNAEMEERVAARTRDLVEANEKLKAEILNRDPASDKLRQLQKMEALGHLTAGIAHDFNNLFTAILGGLEVIRRRVEEPRSLRLIDSSINAAQRGAKLIAQLTAFARKQNLRPTTVSLSTLIREMRKQLEQAAGPAVGLTFDLAEDLWPVMADAKQMGTALLNLTINAREAMADGGTLRIGTSNQRVHMAETDLPAGDYATVTVQDNGPGMTEDVRERLFEPFFTTKSVGKGSGLGLAQVYGLIRQSGGSVRVHSVPGEGTTVTILLPLATGPGEVGSEG